MLPFTVYDAGDTGLVLDFGDRIDAVINRHVLSLSNRLDALALTGVTETVPSFRSLLIQYDPCVLPAKSLLAAIQDLLREDDAFPVAGRLWHVPICYDKAVAEDIGSLAELLGLAESDVIEAHSSRIYSTYMLGFLPGQPYLGDLTAELRVSRRANPRLRIPGGSVGIATSLTSIFPLETPCGWHIIGRTPVGLWHQTMDRGPLLAPGDQVKFDPICLDKFGALSALAASGSLQLTPETIVRPS